MLLEKKKKQEAKGKKQQEIKKLAQTEKEVLQAVKVVREKKKKEAKVEAIRIAEYNYKVGDIVRLLDGRAQGIIEKVEKKILYINYGIFITKASIEKIELVKAVRNKK